MKEEDRLHINCCNQMMDRKKLKEEFVLANGVREYSIRAGERGTVAGVRGAWAGCSHLRGPESLSHRHTQRYTS